MSYLMKPGPRYRGAFITTIKTFDNERTRSSARTEQRPAVTSVHTTPGLPRYNDGPCCLPGLVIVGGGCGVPNHDLGHLLPGLLHDSSAEKPGVPRVGLIVCASWSLTGQTGAPRPSDRAIVHSTASLLLV